MCTIHTGQDQDSSSAYQRRPRTCPASPPSPAPHSRRSGAPGWLRGKRCTGLRSDDTRATRQGSPAALWWAQCGASGAEQWRMGRVMSHRRTPAALWRTRCGASGGWDSDERLAGTRKGPPHVGPGGSTAYRMPGGGGLRVTGHCTKARGAPCAARVCTWLSKSGINIGGLTAG